jgi:hypothetical protein
VRSRLFASLLTLVVVSVAVPANAATVFAVDDGPFVVTPNTTLVLGQLRVQPTTFTLPVPGLLSNDVSGGTLTAALSTPPASGAATVLSTGAFSYSTDPAFAGDVTFTYTASDGFESDTATVTLRVNPQPAARNDIGLVAPGGSVIIDVLANDVDPNGDPLGLSISTKPTYGTALVQTDNKIRYVQSGASSTTDSFKYAVTDGLSTSTARVDVTIAKPLPAGSEDIGMVDPVGGQWHLRDSGTGAVNSFFYGVPGDAPFVGDWDCDGDATPGLYRRSDGFVYVRNSNSQGVADVSFIFGNPSDVPLAGDFNGDGCDTVSVYRPSTQQVFVINKLGTNGGGLGPAEVSYIFGNPGDKPFVGDFDGDGTDTIGLHRESTGRVYFRNSHTSGFADADFVFGNPLDRLVAGDWSSDGLDSPAVFRPLEARFYFRFTNTQGFADAIVPFGEFPWLPVAGTFG